MAQEFDNVRLIWFGSNNTYKDLYKSLESYFSEKIKYGGLVTNVRDYLVKADAFCLSSKMEGFRNNPVKENRIKRALFQVLNDDELVEITPDNIRLRKKYLTSIERRQAYRDAKALEESIGFILLFLSKK